MAHLLMFDTLLYANKLKNAGIESAQAEVQAEGMGEIFEKLSLINQDVENLRKYMDLRFTEMRAEMIKWMIGISAGQAALIISIGKLFH